jgi:hypothetical protein
MKEHTPETQPMSEDTKTILTVLALISIPPVGVILMWIWNKWQTWIKVVVTGCTCLPFILLLIAFMFGFFGFIMSEIEKETTDTLRNNPVESTQSSIKSTVVTRNNNKTVNVFNDVTGGYTVTYDGEKLISCNADGRFQKELILFDISHQCTVGDAPYAVKISKNGDPFSASQNLIKTEDILIDGVKGTKKTYSFTEEDGPLYELGGLAVVSVKAPSKNGDLINIQVAGNTKEDKVLFNEIVSGFKWN